MQFLKSRENNTKFFTDLMKKQILNKKTKNKYQISNCRVCENSTVSATPPPLPPPPTHTHTHPTSKRTPKKPTQIRVKILSK